MFLQSLIEFTLGISLYFFIASLFYIKYKKMSLWVAVKALDMKGKDLIIGYGVYFSMLIIGIAFCLNKLFLIFGIFILFSLFFLSLISFCLVPFVLGAIISRYMLFKDKEIISHVNTLFAVVFMGAVFYLPYIGLFILFSLFAFSLGIVSRYIWHTIF